MGYQSNKIVDTLKKYWGYSTFRTGQEGIIRAVLERRDVLAILPTGGGKSLCYQLPAVMLEGTALVVSPLIALMRDQVQSLIKRNIAVGMLHSGMSADECAQVQEILYQGSLKLLYVSPERLQQEKFRNILQDIHWSILVVDEAHCISEWGHDFRPLYRQIAEATRGIQFYSRIALTASATPETQADICQQLGFAKPFRYVQSIFRSNLSYQVYKPEHKESNLLELAAAETQIIYCPTRRMTEETAQMLRQNGYDAVAFHAGLPGVHKQQIQHQWTLSSSQIMAATNAFGMGIDKPDVRKVIHYTAPSSLEAYYQEAGRAGRDGQYAEAILLVQAKDIKRLYESIAQKFPPIDFVKTIYDTLCNYLAIPIGEGFEQLYFFDLPQFCRKYNLPIFETLGAIRIIEHNGYWCWQQDDFAKDKVRFSCTRSELDELSVYHKSLHALAIGLLRMYGGIFSFETRVDIGQIASFMQWTYEKVKQCLNDLAKLGIIDYTPAQRGSSLYFVESRLTKNALLVNQKRLQFLKERAKTQIDYMVRYMQNEEHCRTRIIAQYFGESSNDDCGICDVCQRKGKRTKGVVQEILGILRSRNSISIEDLTKQLDGTLSRETILHSLQSLQREELIKIQGANIIFVQ